MKMNLKIKLLAIPVLLLATAIKTPAAPTDQPNFVFILGEAQGWASLSVPMDDRYPDGSKSDFILTPNFDRIALEGARFSDFYAPSPRCTPSRAAYLTGISPAQLQMTFVGESKREGIANPGDKVISPPATNELPSEVTTIAELLKSRGYATAHFGKWHVGKRNPKENGFDENDGPNSNAGPEHADEPNPEQAFATADRAMDFISRQVGSGTPFFLQVSHYTSKNIESARPETVEAVKRRLRNRLDYRRIGTAAGSAEIDKAFGNIRDQIEELGISERTYFIFTSDHGAQGNNANGALSNGKGTVWEGGIRVPLLISGPGIPAGQFIRHRASGVDLFPTVAALAGVPKDSLPANLEGSSLVDVLKNGDQGEIQRSREEFIVHFPHYDKDSKGPASAIFLGTRKLIRFYETDERLLYDLSNDIGEEKNLAPSRPEEVEKLDGLLTAYLKTVHAGMPAPNLNFDPDGTRSGERKGGGKRDGEIKNKPNQ
jgi:arylsulfatase A-like enzyme